MMYRIFMQKYLYGLELKSHTNYLGILTKPIAS
jgi:hypothetical protein